MPAARSRVCRALRWERESGTAAQPDTPPARFGDLPVQMMSKSQTNPQPREQTRQQTAPTRQNHTPKHCWLLWQCWSHRSMCAPSTRVSWAHAHACWRLPGKPIRFPLQMLQGAAPRCWPGLLRVGSGAGRAHGKASGRDVQMYSPKNTHSKTSTPRSPSGCPSTAQRLCGSPAVKWGRSSGHHHISGTAVTCARQLSGHADSQGNAWAAASLGSKWH